MSAIIQLNVNFFNFNKKKNSTVCGMSRIC